jgi:hypothetical protein
MKEILNKDQLIKYNQIAETVSIGKATRIIVKKAFQKESEEFVAELKELQKDYSIEDITELLEASSPVVGKELDGGSFVPKDSNLNNFELGDNSLLMYALEDGNSSKEVIVTQYARGQYGPKIISNIRIDNTVKSGNVLLKYNEKIELPHYTESDSIKTVSNKVNWVRKEIKLGSDNTLSLYKSMGSNVSIAYISGSKAIGDDYVAYLDDECSEIDRQVELILKNKDGKEHFMYKLNQEDLEELRLGEEVIMSSPDISNKLKEEYQILKSEFKEEFEQEVSKEFYKSMRDSINVGQEENLELKTTIEVKDSEIGSMYTSGQLAKGVGIGFGAATILATTGLFLAKKQLAKVYDKFSGRGKKRA